MIKNKMDTLPKVIGGSFALLLLLIGSQLILQTPFSIKEQGVVYIFSICLFILFYVSKGASDLKSFGMIVVFLMALWSFLTCSASVVGETNLFLVSLIPSLFIWAIIRNKIATNKILIFFLL